MLKFEKRAVPSKKAVYVAPLIAVLLTLVSCALLFGFMGKNPLLVLQTLFIDPITSKRGLAELGLKATPLILIAVGLSFGFRAGIWNIGAEGQLIIGGLAGGAIALFFYEIEGWYILPLMLTAAMAAGMAWAAIPAFLKVQFRANEILTSLMLVYVADLWLSVLIHGPLKDPDGFNFPESRLFHDAALLPNLFGTRLHLGSLLTLVMVFLAFIIINRHIIGFYFKIYGESPQAAKFAGINGHKMIWVSLMIGGALAGLAGIFEVAGPIGQIIPSFSPGYGFTAIIVAFLGRLHPIGILFAGLLLALTFLGGENAQITLNMPSAITGIFQGLLLFYLLASDGLIKYRLRMVIK